MDRFFLGVVLVFVLFGFYLPVADGGSGEVWGEAVIVIANETGEMRSREPKKKELATIDLEEKRMMFLGEFFNYEKRYSDVKVALENNDLTEEEKLDVVGEYLVSSVGVMMAQLEYLEYKLFNESGLSSEERLIYSGRLNEFSDGLSKGFLVRFRELENLNETEELLREFISNKREFNELLEESALVILKRRAREALRELELSDYNGIVSVIEREEYGMEEEKLENLKDDRKKLFLFLIGGENE